VPDPRDENSILEYETALEDALYHMPSEEEEEGSSDEEQE
jgi:hypothetical protein